MADNLDELFAAMPDEAAVTTYEYLTIDPDTLTIDVPENEALFGVENDTHAETKHFLCPRYVGNGVDLLGCFVRVNFRNANGELDAYLVEDMAADGDFVAFSWTFTRKVTAYKGNVQFLVCACYPNTSGGMATEWHTTLATGVVREGMEPDATEAEAATADVIAQLLEIVQRSITAVDNKEDTALAAVAKTGTDNVAAVNAEGTAQVAAVRQTAADETAAATAAIQAQGAATLATIPAEYANLSAAADMLTRTKAPAIVCTAEGKTIQVADASDDHLRGLRLFGKTTQQIITGAQLFNAYGGNTDCVADDGRTIKLPHYFSSGSVQFSNIQVPVDLKAGKTYTIDFNVSDNGNKWYLYLYNDGRTQSIDIKSHPLTVTPSFDVKTVWLQVSSTNGTQAVFEDFMVNEGDTALPWEPYTGGVAAPSPDYPMELEHLPAPVVGVYGKNLIDADAMVNEQFVKNGDGTYTITKNGTGSLRFSKRAACSIPAGKYVLSVCGATGTEETVRVALTYDDDKELAVAITPTAPKVIDAERKIVKMATYIPADRADGDNTTISGLMMETGDTVTGYEPYKAAQTMAVTSVDNLPGIPVASGGNYTDADGQQWICDEVDLARGVYVQRIFAETITDFTGALSHSYDGVGTSCAVLISENVLAYTGLCSHFMLTSKATGADRFNLIDKTIYFKLSGELTQEEWIARMTELSPTVIGVLTTPIVTALNDADRAAFAALHSNKPTTVLLNDAGAYMAAEYNADTKLYIDRKIAELVAANT